MTILPPERYKCVMLGKQPFYLPRNGHNSERIAWRKIKRPALFILAVAYVTHFNIKTAKALDRGPHQLPGLLARLRRCKLIAKVFDRPKSRVEKLGGEIITIFLKVDKKVDWEKMGKRRSLRYISAFVRDRGITKSSELARGPRSNPGMYKLLQEKKWMDEVFPCAKSKPVYVNGKPFILPLLRDGKLHLDVLLDPDFTDYFNAMCAEHNIRTRTELRRFSTLAQQARKRKLINTLMPDRMEEFERAGQTFSLPVKGKRIMWSTVTAQTRHDFCWAHSLEFDISRPGELAHGPHRMNGLYKAMAANRELHAAFGLPDRRYELLDGDLFCLFLKTDGDIDWDRSGENTLLDYTHAYLRHNGLTQRCELEKARPSLLMILARRGLLRQLFPPTREIITLCGRRFILPQKGRYVQWREIDQTVLNIYAACVWRQVGRLRDLPCQVKKLMNHAVARQYRRRLPTLDNDTAERLRHKYGAPNNYALPDEILWAYGYEKYEEPRIRAKCLRKIEPPLEPIS